MVTLSMSSDEITAHCQQDIDDLHDSAGYKAWMNELYKKYRLKGYPFHAVTPHTYKSRRTGQTYLVYLHYMPVKHHTALYMHNIYIPVHTDKGIAYIRYAYDRNKHNILTAHYVKRYTERNHLQGCEHAALLHHEKFCYDSIIVYTDAERMSGVEANMVGLNMMCFDDDMVILTTFVHENQLIGEQHEAWERCVNIMRKNFKHNDTYNQDEYHKLKMMMYKVCQPIYEKYVAHRDEYKKSRDNEQTS